MSAGTERDPGDVIASLVTLAGKRVVDVGAGEGELARFIAGCGARETIGVECGAEMLALARSGPPKPGLRFSEGVGQSLPLPDATSDVVVFSNSLHHVAVERQRDALHEAGRVLAERGCVVILEPIARGGYQELLAPVHDETQVRAHAQREIANAVSSGLFAREVAFEFHKSSRYPSFEVFRDRLLRINPDRRAAVAAMGDAWRELFERTGKRVNGGWEFRHPVRVDHLRRASVSRTL